jgi:hypothetical protein
MVPGLHRVTPLLASVAILLGACSSAAPSAPAASATTAPSASAKPVLPVADPRKSEFKLHVDKPVILNGPDDSWYANLMAPSAGLYYDGKFHIFHDGAVTYPSLISHGYTYSTDGLTWSVPEPDDPILTPKMVTDAGLALPGNTEIGTVLVDGNQWAMYFTLTSQLNNWHGSIGRATAASPTGPWTIDSKVVLGPGAAGAWDAPGPGFPSVTRTDKGWVMYFSSGANVGMATSPDGIVWSRYDDPSTTDALFADGDPLPQSDGKGGFGPLKGDDPRVVRVGSGWMMTYATTAGDIEYTTSTDGIHWAPGIRIVEAAATGMAIYFCSLIVHDGTAYLYFEAGNWTTDAFLATWKA